MSHFSRDPYWPSLSTVTWGGIAPEAEVIRIAGMSVASPFCTICTGTPGTSTTTSAGATSNCCTASFCCANTQGAHTGSSFLLSWKKCLQGITRWAWELNPQEAVPKAVPKECYRKSTASSPSHSCARAGWSPGSISPSKLSNYQASCGDCDNRDAQIWAGTTWAELYGYSESSSLWGEGHCKVWLCFRGSSRAV